MSNAFSSTLTGCINEADVTCDVSSTSNNAGGIVGYVNNTTITNCSNSGTVSGNVNVGGIASSVSNNVTIENSINTGYVESSAADGGYVGAIIGSKTDQGNILTLTNCAWDSSTADYAVGNDESYNANDEVTKITDSSFVVTRLDASIDPAAINIGDTATITVTTVPDGIADAFGEGKQVSLEEAVSDSACVTQPTVNDDGTITVTGVYEGTANITVTATVKTYDYSTLVEGATPAFLEAEGTTHTYKFTRALNVSDVPVSVITITPEMEQLETETEYTFTANVQPENATDKGVTWTVTGAEKYVDNKDGTVTITTGSNAGSVTITATAQDGSDKYGEQTLDVIIPNVENVTVTSDKDTITDGVGGTATLTASILPTNAQYGDVKWTSSNPAVATVPNEGGTTATVTATGAGTATITATAGGVSGECEITVDEVQADSVTIDETQEEITLTEGGTTTLSASLDPPNSTDKITWTSSDPSIATVDENGKITAHKSGTVTITATTESGVATPITLTVTVAEPPAEEKPEEPATLETPETPATPQQPSSGGGGGGCSAGFGALALLALAPMMLRRKN